MKCKCSVNSEYFVSFAEKSVKCELELDFKYYSGDIIDFSVSSSVLIEEITFNGKPAFFSRSPNEKDNYNNLHVFIPIGFDSFLWSPVPNLSKKSTNLSRRSFTLNIKFKIPTKCPSIVWNKNFVYTSNYAYGIQGWMPKLLSNAEILYNRLKISCDRPDYTIFGPTKISIVTEQKIGGNSKVFSLQNLNNAELLGWAIGDLNFIEIKQFKVYFVDNIEQSSLAFLSTLSEHVSKTVSPIIIVPDLFNDVSFSLGFILINENMFSSYSSFSSLLYIPPSLHLIVSVCYAIAADTFGNVSDFCDCKWFFVGLMSAISRKYYSVIFGKSTQDFYEWSMIRYLYILASNDDEYDKLNCTSWDLESPQRLKAHYAVNLIVSNIQEDKLEDFALSIPKHINLKILEEFLSPYIENPEKYISFSTQLKRIPVYNVSISWASKDLVSNCITKVHFSVINDAMFDSFLPMSVSVFSITGASAKDVSVSMSEDSEYEFDLFKKKPRIRKTPPDSKEPIPVDFLLFPAVEANPRVPAIIMYDIDPQMLINIVKTYNCSVYVQHEALASLQKILNDKGDDTDYTIIRYLITLLNDDNAFYSLRCHAIKILGNVMRFFEEFDAICLAKNNLVSFFTTKITGKNSSKLQNIGSLNPCIIISMFRCLSQTPYVTELSSYYYISNAILQSSGTILEPYLIQCMSFVEVDKKNEWKQLSEFLLDKIKNADDILIKSLSIEAYERFGRSLSQHTMDFWINFLIDKIFDRSFDRIVRQSIARLIIRWVPNEASIAVLQIAVNELNDENPDYIYVEKIMCYLVNALPSWGDRVTTTIKDHANMSLIFENIRFIMSKISQSHNAIHEHCKKLYCILFDEEKWPLTYIPDGIIKTCKLDLDDSIDEGMFSSDDDI